MKFFIKKYNFYWLFSKFYGKLQLSKTICFMSLVKCGIFVSLGQMDWLSINQHPRL